MDDLMSIHACDTALALAPSSPAVQPLVPASKRRLWLGVIAAAAYLLLACLAYWPVAPLSGTHTVAIACARCSDHAQDVWFLSWTAFALLHGHNPLLSGYLMLPRGA